MLVFAVFCLLASPLVGARFTTFEAVFRPQSTDVEASIFWSIRLPRVLAAFLAGSALAMCGMVFQAMFRNPLATESTLGVASGASFGAALQVRLGLTVSLWGLPNGFLFAFFGAALSVGMIAGLARLRRGLSTSATLLAGVAISFIFSSLILLVQSTSDFHNSFRLLRWLMGGLASADYRTAANLLIFTLLGIAVIGCHIHELNLLLTGDELAASRGVAVNRTKAILFVATSLTVGGVVALTGPIGFVGMIAPHVCRLMIGCDHRRLLPATLLFGGGFLTLCDTAARMITAPAEMPAGAITALLGGPFLLWLLITATAEGRRT
ncbi:MAG: iron ABC transporter permease [Phycisphaeraceae bacterium]|nr:iron ABC transporter permease [Phycisphaeraceae bacterium]